MLKSSVPVLLCSLTFITFPSAANSTHNEPENTTTSAVNTKNLGSSAVTMVSFAIPTRGMKNFVVSYLKENDESLSRIKRRSALPFTIIDSVMNHYELPTDLKYLAVIESELNATATSRVGARGPWQLMAGTARDLGLKITNRYDERTNMRKSTRAAALYLR